jgi:hypothetical protein
MADPKGITTGKLAAALRKHGGIYALVAQELGCTRSNISQRVSRTPKLQEVCREIEEEFGDLAEGVIKSTLNERDPATRKPTNEAKRMARWYAPLKLRDRGYVTRQEHTGKDGAPLPAAPAGKVEVVIVYRDGPGEPGDVI